MLAFSSAELAFFTTELTEERWRATEYYKYLGKDIAPCRILRGARCSPKKLSSSVALRQFSVSSVVKKASVVVKKASFALKKASVPR